MRFICAVLVSLISSVSFAQSPFPVRFVDVGQTVTVPAGEYTLTKPTVVRGGTLVLDAGVRVKVQSIGRPFEMAGGVLDFRGTAESPVVVEADNGHTSGHMVCYTAYGQRPQLRASYLEWSTTKSGAGTCFVLSSTDFVIENSTFYSASAGSTRRGCVQAGNNSSGVVSNCMLECLKEPNVVTSGVIVGNGTSQTDKVQLFDVVTVNCTNPININNRHLAVLNGSIE